MNSYERETFAYIFLSLLLFFFFFVLFFQQAVMAVTFIECLTGE